MIHRQTERDGRETRPAQEKTAPELNLLTPGDLRSITGLGKNQVYALMNSSGFPSMRLNNRIFVTEAAFASWLKTYQGRTYLF